ncbi:MAG: cell division protein ZapA [Prevotellaceae bacterium]|jgi:hypothetical protein|nr:cell division protein ZapA [Prevotellaceae bacterium]
MDIKDDSKKDVLCLHLKLGDKEISFRCKGSDEAAVRQAAIRYNEVYSQYSEHYNNNIAEDDLLRITGFHFAYQLLIQSNKWI